jgi:large repetitive protein
MDGTVGTNGMVGTGLTPPDADTDGKPNYIDLDSDNDSISDLVESGNAAAKAADTNRDGILTTADTGVTDADGDGIMSPADGSPTYGDASDAAPVDQPAPDADTTPDYLDPDSDGDGTPDITEAGNGALDTNNDGKIDAPATDSDGDGIPDVIDSNDTTPGGLSDPLGDNDGDGIPNGEEGNGLLDTDGDGVPNSMDADSDNDGISDATEKTNAINGGDTDGDGVKDWLDLDSDPRWHSRHQRHGWHRPHTA